MLDYKIDDKTTAFTRYSTISDDPSAPKYGRTQTVDFGITTKLAKNAKLKVSYITTKEQKNKVRGNNGICAELLITY